MISLSLSFIFLCLFAGSVVLDAFRAPIEISLGILYGVICGLILWFLPTKQHVSLFILKMERFNLHAFLLDPPPCCLLSPHFCPSFLPSLLSFLSFLPFPPHLSFVPFSPFPCCPLSLFLLLLLLVVNSIKSKEPFLSSFWIWTVLVIWWASCRYWGRGPFRCRGTGRVGCCFCSRTKMGPSGNGNSYYG